MALHEFSQVQRLKIQFKECNASQGGYYTSDFGCKAIVNGIEYQPGNYHATDPFFTSLEGKCSFLFHISGRLPTVPLAISH